MTVLYFIPDGPKNLLALFPDIDFRQVESYRLSVVDFSGTTLATSPEYTYDKPCEEDLVLHFINSLGAEDTVKVSLTGATHETKSDTYRAPLKYPLVQNLHGINRTNLQTTDTFTGVCLIPEDQLEWFKEFLDSPKTWYEDDSDYVPIVLVDNKTPVLNDVPDRYEYQIQISFILSHPKITLR